MRRCSRLLLLCPQALATGPSVRALPCRQQRHLSHGSSLDLAAGPTYTIWGANTGVGKTLASMGLARAARNLQVPLLYLKPVQTGFPTDSDARAVALACGLAESAGPHAAQLLPASGQAAAPAHSASNSVVKVLYAWSRACGPHEAMASEGRAVTDAEVLSSIVSELGAFKARLPPAAAVGSSEQPAQALALVETAGGVASPAPSGDLQCDLLRPLRLPCILVGDARLGGISATISAYESLTLRGYDVDFIVLLEPPVSPASPISPILPGSVPVSVTSLNNGVAIQRHLDRAVHRLGMRTRVMTFPGCAAPTPDEVAAANGGLDAAVKTWLGHTQPHFTGLVQLLMQQHTARRSRLAAMADQASAQIWWPFTQHASLAPGSVQVIDARCGEHWQVLGQDRKPGAGAGSRDVHASVGSKDRLTTVYDACSSWWTQAVPARWHPEVAQAVAYAAGRYMHVMFPENAHEPAVLLADRLLSTMGSGWASRVFYSDDGSTAVEVALKMAFRKYLHDHELGDLATAATAATTTTAASPSIPELQVLGLHNAYHGDTLGAMDCVAPSVYNGPLQAAWYRGRGLFLQPPYVALVKGRWTITNPPSWLQQQWQGIEERGGREVGWGSLDEVLSTERDGSELRHIYRQYIEAEMQRHSSAGRGRLAATILEPLLQGAGGMLLVDPQFQRAMVQVCRDRSIPIIFDEVMTGMYRLGALSGAQLLRCQPDLACYAKILTAGVVPMAVTLASSAVFDAFQGPSKLQALLHGHSYTAYPVGCAAALAALDILCNPESNPNLCAPSEAADADAAAGGRNAQPSAALASVTTPLPGAQPSSCCRASAAGQASCGAPCGRLLALWDDEQVSRLSHHAAVSRVVAIGTLVAVEVSSGTASRTAGYAAGGAAVQVARQLLHNHGIFCRPLGPVLYLMVPPATDRRQCQQLLERLEQELDAVVAAAKDGASSSEEGVVV